MSATVRIAVGHADQGKGRLGDAQWQVRAACRGPHATVFFPPSHTERKDERAEREAQAKAICESCSVREPCLHYALRIREPHGIWGGLNEVERRQLLAN